MLPSHTRPLARLVLLSLIVTFVLARLVTILITLHRMPNIYFHVRDTHVHHLNYGIFLLARGGAVARVVCPAGQALATAAARGGDPSRCSPACRNVQVGGASRTAARALGARRPLVSLRNVTFSKDG